jgi:hypothetical protein
MKVRVVVTDGGGNTFEGEATLVAVAGARAARPTPRGQPQPSTRTKPDFSLPVRAFIKQHVKGLGGPQKFTALLAKLSGGKTGTAVERREIEKTWNRMTALMGGKFNPSYTTRAKDNGWVDTPKTGHYALRSGWEKALGG